MWIVRDWENKYAMLKLVITTFITKAKFGKIEDKPKDLSNSR